MFLNQAQARKITVLENILILNNMICHNPSSISPSVRTLLLTPGKISQNLINYAIFERNHLIPFHGFLSVFVSVSSIKVVELSSTLDQHQRYLSPPGYYQAHLWWLHFD